MRMLCVALAITGMLTLSARAATSETDTGTSTITFDSITGGGTCTVAVTTPVQVGDQNGIDPTLAIGHDWVGLAHTPFNVNLTDCVGLGGTTTLTPKITLTGATLTGKSAAAGDRLFSSGTNNTGFGIIIYKTSTPGSGITDIATVSDGTIPLPGYGAGSVLNGTVHVPLVAAVGCGATADCSESALRPGALSASITFGFAYK